MGLIHNGTTQWHTAHWGLAQLPISINIWFRWINHGISGGLVSVGNFAAEDMYHVINAHYNTPRLLTRTAGDLVLAGPDITDDDTYHHIVAQIIEQQITIRVDGGERLTSAWGGSAGYGVMLDDIAIGRIVSSAIVGAAGFAVEHVAVWSASLTTEEELALYNRTTNPAEIQPGALRTYIPFVNSLAPAAGTLEFTHVDFDSPVYEVSGITYPSTGPTWGVTYNGNGSEGGTVPVDGTFYADGETVTPAGNTGGLTRAGYAFQGWALTPGGSPVESFVITADTTLYAVWAEAVPATTLVFTTSGASFAPRIEVSGTPEILWTFSDGSTSNSMTPSVSFGSAGSREHTLTVTPWSALVGINLGYGADDGGSEDIPIHPAQDVTAIDGLEYVQDTLQYLCGSRTPITTLDLSGFTALHTVEFFQGSLTSINVSGCTALRRICLEECNIPTLDLTGLSALEDLRYAVNGATGLTLPATAPGLWHICIRDNPNIGISPVFRYPAIRDLYVWNCGLSGACAIEATAVHQILIYDNPITSIDLSACGFMADLDLWAQGCSLSQGAVDAILQAVDAGGVTSGSVNLSGGSNSAPSTMVAVDSLRAKGLAVTINAIPTHAVTFNAAGGAGTIPSMTIPEGGSAALTSNTFTRTGYTFLGWATTQGGPVVYQDGATVIMGTQDIALYAVWEAIPVETFGVTYSAADATSGVVPSDTAEYEEGQTVVVATNPGSLARTGHTFAGWSLSVGGQVITSFQITADTILYAVWTTNSHSISFDANGGTGTMASVSVQYGETVQIPTNAFSRTGYTFLRWMDQDGNNYSGNANLTMGDSDIVLSAQWESEVSVWTSVPKLSQITVAGLNSAKSAFVTTTVRLSSTLSGDITGLTGVVIKAMRGDKTKVTFPVNAGVNGLYFADITVDRTGVFKAYFEASYSGGRQVESDRTEFQVTEEY